MYERLLNSKCNIYNYTTTVNAIGEQVVSKSLLFSNINCRKNDISDSPTIFMDNINISSKIKVFVEYSASYQEWQFLEFVIDGTPTNIFYKIQEANILNTKSNSHHVEIAAWIEARY